MHYRNKSGMATLLQPQNNKNCMKNLNGNSSSVAATTILQAQSQQQQQQVVLTSSQNNDQQHQPQFYNHPTTTITTMLLPHEIAQFNNSNMTATSSSSAQLQQQQQQHLIMNNSHHGASSSFNSSPTATAATTNHQLNNLHHNHNNQQQQQQQHNQSNSSSSHINLLNNSQQQNQQFNNNNNNNSNNATRHFSQFSNSNNSFLINSSSTTTHKLLPHQLPPNTSLQQLQTSNENNSVKKQQGNQQQVQHLNNGDCKSNILSDRNSNCEVAGAANNLDINEDSSKDNKNLVIVEQTPAVEQEPEPEIDIVINNVVCSFSVRCHLNLRDIALNGFNVEFRRENGMVTMKLRRPYTTASIWSSGRITCTGATSELQAKIAARRYSRCLQKLGFRVRFNNFRVVNVLGTCSMPWAIKIVNFSEKYKKDASYEPELHPGVTYKLKYPKATLKIFSTGSITVTAASVAHVQNAIEHIFPLVYEFRKKRTPQDLELLRIKQETAMIKQLEMEQYRYIHSRRAKKRKHLETEDEGADDDAADDDAADNTESVAAASHSEEIITPEADFTDDIIEECVDTDDE